MRICLDLIQKDQSVLSIPHLVPSLHAEGQIKILHCPDIFEQSGPQRIFQQVDFNITTEQLAADIPDDVGLAHLPGSGNDQHLVRIRLQVLLDAGLNLSKKHKNTLFL